MKRGILMKTKIFFDLDGTVFDLYGKSNWLELLENEKSGAFNGNFLPYIDKLEFFKIVGMLMDYGVEFNVITWLPKNASAEYMEICIKEKIEWVRKNMPFIKSIECIPYGTPKQKYATKSKRMYLLDDNIEVCNTWNSKIQRKAKNVSEKYSVVNALWDIFTEI